MAYCRHTHRSNHLPHTYTPHHRRMKLAAIKVETSIRFMQARKYVKNLRKQFKNQPPRIWARQVQRVYRGHAHRMGMDEETYEKGHRLGLRLQEMLRRTRASSKLGAWYRAQAMAKRYKAIRTNLIKIQVSKEVSPGGQTVTELVD